MNVIGDEGQHDKEHRDQDINGVHDRGAAGAALRNGGRQDVRDIPAEEAADILHQHARHQHFRQHRLRLLRQGEHNFSLLFFSMYI